MSFFDNKVCSEKSDSNPTADLLNIKVFLLFFYFSIAQTRFQLSRRIAAAQGCRLSRLWRTDGASGWQTERHDQRKQRG